jgi:hypothetical protein
MRELDNPESTDGERHRPGTASLKSQGVLYWASRACLSRLGDHLVAILVYLGSDPTVPYQAWVTRESARLFSGFAPWGRKAFSAREPLTTEVYSPDPFDSTTVPPSRANTIGKMSPST